MDYHNSICAILDALQYGGAVVAKAEGFDFVPVPLGSAVDVALIIVIHNDDGSKSVTINMDASPSDVVMTAKAVFALVSLVAM